VRPYQIAAAQFTADAIMSHNGAALFLSPGLGKTAVSISTINLLHYLHNVHRVLIVAPTRVLPHWHAEAARWGSVLPVNSLYDRSPTVRDQLIADNGPGIYTISHGLLHWLTQKTHPRFDLLVIDESSYHRNWSSQRTKAARRMAVITPSRLLLSGSPAPNTPAEMFPQAFLLDRGLSLGTTLGQFQAQYCHRGGYENREYLFTPERAPALQSAIAHLCIRQDSTLLTGFPALTINPVTVTLPPDALTIYKQMEGQLYTDLTSKPILALSGSAKYLCTRQLASGSCYVSPTDRTVQFIHDEKLQACAGIIQETLGPVIIAYQFTHELRALQAAFPSAPHIAGGTSLTDTTHIIDKWRQHQTPILLAQSQSISHGVDGLQYGGSSIIWYTLTDSSDTFTQFNARLARSGQTQPVVAHVLLAQSTIDKAILRSVQNKLTTQEALLEYFRQV
jgi:superfamily II DNA or RNA helicase